MIRRCMQKHCPSCVWQLTFLAYRGGGGERDRVAIITGCSYTYVKRESLLSLSLCERVRLCISRLCENSPMGVAIVIGVLKRKREREREQVPESAYTAFLSALSHPASFFLLPLVCVCVLWYQKEAFLIKTLSFVCVYLDHACRNIHKKVSAKKNFLKYEMGIEHMLRGKKKPKAISWCTSL